MQTKTLIKTISILSLFNCLIGCYEPPYNNFEPYASIPSKKINYETHSFKSTQELIHKLNTMDIQYVQYGDTRTLILPTDRYFTYNSPTFNQFCYKIFPTLLDLLNREPHRTLYVAAFTDNVNTRFRQKKLTQARAETMITYLWAHGIKAEQLSPEGYGEKYAIASNHTIHGSAQNRRLEIQWINDPNAASCCK